MAVLGEEGVAGRADAEYRWVVDPIDGTVNFAYGIPHACVSIALQRRAEMPGAAEFEDGYQSLVGVVYDPFCGELWTGIRGQAARLNGKIIRVSKRRKLGEAIVSIGFAKTRENLEATLPSFIDLAHSVRKIRIMGSAALDLAYVATGRFDAYIEQGIRLWDVAAGGLIVECAGGEFWHRAIPGTTPTASPPATACFGVTCVSRSDRPRRDNPPSRDGHGTRSRSASSRRRTFSRARARWLNWFFTSSLSSPNVCSYPLGMKNGS